MAQANPNVKPDSPTFSSTILNVTCTHFSTLVHATFLGQVPFFSPSVTVIVDYFSFLPSRVPAGGSAFGSLTMPTRQNPSSVPAFAAAVFDDPFEEVPMVFGQVRLGKSLDNERAPSGGFAISVSKVTASSVEFSFMCLNDELFQTYDDYNGSNEDNDDDEDDYPCVWKDFYFIDWRAWPRKGMIGANTTLYGNLYELDSSKQSALVAGHQDTEVQFSDYSDLKFNAPPGMIAMVHVGKNERNNVFGVSVGINTVQTQKSFFPSLQLISDKRWKDNLSLAWFAWNGTGVYCESTGDVLCNGHGVCPGGGSDESLRPCICDDHWVGSGCTECAPSFATTKCKPCDGYVEFDGNGVCNGHGTCDEGKSGSGKCNCQVEKGYTGADCGTCSVGWYGDAAYPNYQDCSRCPYSSPAGKVCNGLHAGSCVSTDQDEQIWACACKGNFSGECLLIARRKKSCGNVHIPSYPINSSLTSYVAQIMILTTAFTLPTVLSALSVTLVPPATLNAPKNAVAAANAASPLCLQKLQRTARL